MKTAFQTLAIAFKQRQKPQVLKTKYDFAEAITPRPQWQVDRWYYQLLADIKRMLRCYHEGYWDYSLDHACTEYGGCPF